MEAIAELRDLIGRHRLGLTNTQSIIGMAHRLLEDGVYSRSAVDLILLESPVFEEVSSLLESMCKELGVEMPGRDAAIDRLIFSALESIASEAQSSFAALERLVEIYWGFCSDEDVGGYAGGTRGIYNLVSSYYSWLELVDSRSLTQDASQKIAELEADVKLLARERLAQYAANP